MTRPTAMPAWARGALDNFGWADDAARLWPELHRKTRELVMAAARAEIASSRAYNRAAPVIERAVKRETRRRLARIRFT